MKKKSKDTLSFRHRLLRKAKILFWILCIGLLVCLIGYFFVLYGGRTVVDEDKLQLAYTTTIETSEGDVIGKLYKENRNFVPIETIPEHVKQAFLSIEDRRYYDHLGVDLKSISRAVYKNILTMSKAEGASTITQQLVKNLFLTSDKTWSRKAKEALGAIYLEHKLSKDQIFELYLNQMYFGHGVYGVETAANYFFSKSSSDLTIREGALLAGLAKAPNGYSPIRHPEKALKRRNIVLNSMEDAGVLSKEVTQQEQVKDLGLNLAKEEDDPWYDSYVDLVIKEAKAKYELSIDDLQCGGYRIVTGIDKNIQKIAYKKFQEDDYFPGNSDGVEGSFVMMDNKNGEIVAALGGRNYELGHLNRVVVKRQPGSTFKPLAVYGPALMKKERYHPFTLIPDQKVEIENYMVSNVDNMYNNAVTIYDAMVTSKNTSAVWLLNDIGIDYSKSYLSKLGMELEDNWLSIALGGLTYGVTPIQLMEGYHSFINNGKRTESYTIRQIVNREKEKIIEVNPLQEKVFSPQVAWFMTEMLSAVVEKGTGQAGEYHKALAGKTGSTEHPVVEGETKDAWFVGFTPEYVSALWMGYDRSDAEHYLTGGSSYPTALTKSILAEIDEMYTLQEKFEKPNNVKDLPKPIQLPEIQYVNGKIELGGPRLIRSKLAWESSNDDERVVYRIYRERKGIDERIGEVVGKTEYIFDYQLFHSNRYYVVPYDPLTKQEGKPSDVVSLVRW